MRARGPLGAGQREGGLLALASSALLSLLPALLESASGGGFALAGASCTAVALVPWLALATLPQRPGASGSRPGAALAFQVGVLSLPGLGLGLGLDLARGAALVELVPRAGGSWIVLVLWALASGLAVGSHRASVFHGAIWFLLLPGSGAAWAALQWAGASAERPTLGLLAAANPLVVVHRWGREGGLSHTEPRELLPVLLAALLVTLLCGLFTRGGARGKEGQ